MNASADFDLTMDEIRAVAAFAASSAEEILPFYEQDHPFDDRPRVALDAAHEFVAGAPRGRRQRVTAMDAHRAAQAADSEPAKMAARSAGDAAAAAYLHPLRQATQVGHILRATAGAARVAELQAGDDLAVGDEAVVRAAARVTPVVVDVLRRYPPAPVGRSRVAQLMSGLDTAIRERRQTPM